MNIYRHGDIILKQLKVKPGEEPNFKGNSFVVAEGEATGHNHTLTCEKEDGVVVWTKGDSRFIELQVEGILSHQEHKPIAIEPGVYQVLTEREYDPFTEETRRVRD